MMNMCVCVYIHTCMHVYVLRALFTNALVSYDSFRLLAEGNMSVEHRWNGSDRGQPKYLERYHCQC